MSQNPYVQFYTSDFLGGTSGMTAACKGVYITLLCQMYEAESPLGQSWDMLARRCGCTLPAFKRAISDLVDDGKITITDDGIWSTKCEKHIALRRERQNSASSAAKKRWEKTQQKQDEANTDAVKAQCQPEPEPEPINTLEDKSSNEGQAFDASEAAIWKRGVPFLSERGVAEQKARQMIGKWIRDHGSADLFKALSEAAKSGTGDPIPYITKILTQPAQTSVAEMVKRAGEKLRNA